MKRMRLQSSAEQVAEHLRWELASGNLRGLMPGVIRLEQELGVNRKTVEAGLRLLENEGLLVSRGPGRSRLIDLSAASISRPKLRVTILAYEVQALNHDCMHAVGHSLEAAGHVVTISSKTLMDLGMDVSRVSRHVRSLETDAIIVGSGSREILEWFANQPLPAIAMFGRRRGLALAGVGPDKPPVMAAATRRLIELGHRRMVLLTRRSRRIPQPGASERAFLDELETAGIPVSDYNLPDWEETAEGFHARLDSLFRHTPPTALIIDEAPFFAAAHQHLAGLGLRVPEDVSMICTDDDPVFEWYKPAVSHIRWNARPVVRRIVQWATNVSHGKPDLRQTLTKAELVMGGTLGPVKR